ncbi:unnamed protein product [Miscanthus lutarioriparius]|uniref:Uncharacterized protein n=1 Tax=Miscanthus lutarioriparius TaxID=422564 RepID=A0A811PQV8_9POAL|nr:unnamed protein product [Miscanthus lutarioriparius]
MARPALPAYDVLKNFKQRWRKATKLREMFGGKAAHRKDDALLKLERIPWILSPSKRRSAAAGDADADDDERDQPALHVVPDGDPERWHAQVFRSVDAGSVKRFPRPWERAEMARRHLVGDKNLAIEQSIHTAYVAAVGAGCRNGCADGDRQRPTITLSAHDVAQEREWEHERAVLRRTMSRPFLACFL